MRATSETLPARSASPRYTFLPTHAPDPFDDRAELPRKPIIAASPRSRNVTVPCGPRLSTASRARVARRRLVSRAAPVVITDEP